MGQLTELCDVGRDRNGEVGVCVLCCNINGVEATLAPLNDLFRGGGSLFIPFGSVAPIGDCLMAGR